MISRRTVRGGTRLTFDLVEGVTQTVESMHETIARHPMPRTGNPGGPTGAHGKIAALVYTAIRGTTVALREATDALMGLIPEDTRQSTLAREEIRALGALNGVMGDHLESSGNTLAIPMTVIHEGRELALERQALRDALPDARGHVVLLVHGLCLTELCWQGDGQIRLAARLTKAIPCTTLQLRYNTGRHISSNGRELAQLLESLQAAWPVEFTSLTLIGHSMGGLVIRSACWYADAAGSSVLRKLGRVFFLGTPHHGSMVERAGHAFDLAIRKYPYVAPLAVGRYRSAGVKDLYHGDLLDEDWQDHEPDTPRCDRRRSVPLLPNVDYYFTAAHLGDSQQHPLSVALGDLLVRVDSAVGEHEVSQKHLPVPENHCRIFSEKDHFDLLTDESVHTQIVDWLCDT